MRLLMITAVPDPAGNRIDVSWQFPDAPLYANVRLVRRIGTYPVSPNPATNDDGVVVANIAGSGTVADTGLRSEIVYYYALFPYNALAPDGQIVIDQPSEQIDAHNRVSAMATGRYNFAGQMYELLPAIYHRYDLQLPSAPYPEDMPAANQQYGQLRRYLGLPGMQLDQLYSFARAALGLHDVNNIDSRLLPRLAEWIGWKTDYALEIAQQRNEIKYAPFVYETIGIIPTLEATVKRVTTIAGMPDIKIRTKEFIHNVAFTNRPERLNLWALQRGQSGSWLPAADAPLSLNFAYEGRPAFATKLEGTKTRQWLFFHTYRKNSWNIWYKSRTDKADWTESKPLVHRASLDRHPAAAVQGDTIWVFWDVYDAALKRWRVDYTRGDGDRWSEVATLFDLASERRLPAATADANGRLWLFWLEGSGAAWTLKYNCFDGNAWMLPAAETFPLDAGVDARVECDLWVHGDQTKSASGIFVFWSRQDPPGGAQTVYTVACRRKRTSDPSQSDWDPIFTVPKDTSNANHHDREPATLVDTGGGIEVFWSSNRSGSCCLWRNTLDVTSGTWGATPEQLTNEAFSHRAPLPMASNAGTMLVYGSNQGVSYTNEVYGATKTTDQRYAGTTTADTRNKAKNAMRAKYGDFQCYTNGTSVTTLSGVQDLCQGDAIGTYLDDPSDVQRARLVQALPEVTPVMSRTVLIQDS